MKKVMRAKKVAGNVFANASKPSASRSKVRHGYISPSADANKGFLCPEPAAGHLLGAIKLDGVWQFGHSAILSKPSPTGRIPSMEVAARTLFQVPIGSSI